MSGKVILLAVGACAVLAGLAKTPVRAEQQHRADRYINIDLPPLTGSSRVLITTNGLGVAVTGF